ncbi:MAG: cysteine synthase family protein [Euryarchaeota archaeon]|nr:cysteine synthase family protein [Euryarchaeota archaeon]
MNASLNILDLVGRTPMVRINRLNKNPNVELYAKLERFNPGGSVKDRIAKYMIEGAERDGRLTKDKVVIEPTSGNTGIGLAIVCAIKGYRLELVMPSTMTMERRRILLSYGAKIVLSDGTKGMDGAEDLVKEIVAKGPGKYFRPNQFDNASNAQAHYETTGKEIWEDTEGEVAMFVAGLGTTGTLMGVSRRLKDINPSVRIVAVEPYPGSKIQGLKNLDTQYVPGIFDPKRLDEKVKVKDDDAFEMARRLALEEGIFAGISSGAAMHVAVEKAWEMERGVIVVLLPDGGERYISTSLFDPKKCAECARKCGIETCYTEEDLEKIKEWI